MKWTSPSALVTGAVVVALTLSACGDDDNGHGSGHSPGMAGMSSSATPSTAAGRQGDISFAQQMIPHHRQAVQMADMALGKKGVSADVTRLATDIKKAQDPEITKMSGWLRSWGAAVPSAGSHAGHDMSGMPGMMSEQDMSGLEKASGAAFDRMWLTMMIKHHRCAVTMATDVKKTTTNPEVTTLADAVITGQNTEIRTMQGLLKPASS